MTITNLSLINFRNHKNVSYTFSPDINIIVGQNGIGKTNILEAVYLLTTTRSFRAKEDKDMINFDSEYANITAHIKKEDFNDILEITLINEGPKTTKRVLINKSTKTMSNFAGNLLSVLFTPRDLNIFQGTPADRRSFFDLALIQCSKEYKETLLNYAKVVKTRNSIFKNQLEKPTNLELLPYWDEKLVAYGNKLQEYRENFVNFITSRLEKSFIYQKSDLSIDKLVNNRYKELGAKITLYGPHREDFSVLDDHRDLSHFGSRGQQRTTVLDLKLIELEYIKKMTKEIPILLLDDIFSELDETNRDHVLQIAKNQQTLITSAHKEFLVDNANIISL